MNEILKPLLDACEEVGNLTIFDSFIKTAPKIKTNRQIVCSISGGSDSDIMLDILCKLDVDKKIKYVFFDTGIEYQATKDHLTYLENKYGIVIERMKAKVPVPLGCRKYGLPFWSKDVSNKIARLQKNNFKWEDKPYEELIKEYPKCKLGVRWWCNAFDEGSKFNINRIKGLKEFMIANPPTFKISDKCCQGAKKDNGNAFCEANNADLSCIGIRKAEGGIRSVAYKNCFSTAKKGETWDNYRPIFWYLDEDKRQYEELFGVTHSECYTKYGLKRTGCAGCPFSRLGVTELKAIQEHEPKLFNAVNKIFGESYEYTMKFYKFRQEHFGMKPPKGIVID